MFILGFNKIFLDLFPEFGCFNKYIDRVKRYRDLETALIDKLVEVLPH